MQGGEFVALTLMVQEALKRDPMCENLFVSCGLSSEPRKCPPCRIEDLPPSLVCGFIDFSSF